MSRYPNTDVGERGDGDLLTAMIDDIYLKTAATTHTSDAVLSNDPDLANIALAVGLYEIDLLYFADGANGNVQSAWTFSGTVTATPRRFCQGPGSSNTGTSSNVNFLYQTVVNYNTAVTYELVGAGVYGIWEVCTMFEVTAAGNLAVQFAQGTSNASATTIGVGTRLKLRQIG